MAKLNQVASRAASKWFFKRPEDRYDRHLELGLKLQSLLSVITLLAIACPAFGQEATVNRNVPASNVAFFSTYCIECHGEKTPEAGFRIDRMILQVSLESELDAWKEVLLRLESRDMPPKDLPRPSESEFEKATSQIRVAIEQIEYSALAKQPRALRRLNRDEYANTIRDLFGIRLRPVDDFPPDAALQGFDTVADALILSPPLVEKYLAAAEAVLDRSFRPASPDHKPQTTKAAFYEEHYNYPQGTSVSGLGVYNGNAHMTFGPEDKKRVVYIGGPSLFSYGHIDPINNPAHAFNSEGTYRLRATLTPQNFEPGSVASFIVLGAEKRLVAELDIPILENGKPITIETDGYYDRSDSLVGFEIQWTNGSHLQWPSRGRLLKLPFDNSDQNKPWWHINYRIEGGKRVEWKPKVPEELPFSYFEKVEFEINGPFRETPQATVAWFGNFGTDHNAAKVFERFLPLAFRRPVTPSEVERYTHIVQKQRDKGLDDLDALKVGLTSALCSPHFLFMVENSPDGTAPGGYVLNKYELATRLSYFLWSSCPDEELRRLAESGALAEPDVLGQQVTRMLADPKADAIAKRFTRQWLNLDKLATVMPEPKLFPDWSENLRDSCRAETVAFFREVLTANRPITDFLASDWTFVNEDLAQHYELPAVSGRNLRRVSLPDERRGGLISQAAVLTLTSEATRTAPVIRGAFVLDKLFHRPPPPPPANVGTLIPNASQAKSVREHLNIHRADSSCAGCHAKFDGYGLALENFDATGRWRTDERAYDDPAKPIARPEGEKPITFAIDTEVALADGSRFDGVGGMKRQLLAKKVDFARGLAERLAIYACGRGLTMADRTQIDAIVRTTAKENYAFHSLIKATVNSQMFRTR